MGTGGCVHSGKHHDVLGELYGRGGSRVSGLRRAVDQASRKKLEAVSVALYTPGPTEAEAAAFGLTLEEASGPPVGVWPDNLMSVNTFISMSTQWLSSMGGAIGLNYASLPFVFRMVGVRKNDQADVFDDIRLMEETALKVMRRK